MIISLNPLKLVGSIEKGCPDYRDAMHPDNQDSPFLICCFIVAFCNREAIFENYDNYLARPPAGQAAFFKTIRGCPNSFLDSPW
jgi:hypothetical protein